MDDMNNIILELRVSLDWFDLLLFSNSFHFSCLLLFFHLFFKIISVLICGSFLVSQQAFRALGFEGDAHHLFKGQALDCMVCRCTNILEHIKNIQ